MTLTYSWGITMLGMIGMSASVDIIMFIFFGIVAGLGVNGAFNVCFVIINETCSSSYR